MKRLTAPLLIALLCIGRLPAQPADSILLWPERAPGALGQRDLDIPVLLHYPAGGSAAVVVCPGGGYNILAMDHEGHQIARWLNGMGVTAYILKYRLGKSGYRHPAPLLDAQRALRTVRARAEAESIDPGKIGIMGFSAGGHLASTAGTHWDPGDPAAGDPISRMSCRPDFMILIYPVISFTAPFAHKGSARSLLGENPDPELLRLLSNELRVNPQTPPAFLVHTTQDTVVPPDNSAVFYLALRSAGVPGELHIYEEGRHGLGLGPPELPFSSWPERCRDWLRAMKIL
jgi:acetyl esterase/lipase